MIRRQPLRPALPQLKRSRIRLRSFLFFAIPLFLALGAATYFSMIAAGVLYAVVFVVLAFVNPAFALMITFASASFITDLPLGGFQLSFGEISLALLFPVTLLRTMYERRVPDMGPLFFPAVLYVGMCAFSTALHWNYSAVNAMIQMCVYLFVAVIVFSSTLKNPLDLFPAFDVSLIAGAFLAVAALATNYTFLNLHKNAWGAIMSTLILIAVELWFAATNRRRKTILLGVIVAMGMTLLFALSRGAWLGVFAGVLTLIILRRQFKLALRLVLLLAPVIAVCWFFMPQENKEYALGFEMDRGNIAGRINVIQYCVDTFLSNPIFGVGISVRKEVDATNIVLITLAETGVIGLLLFLWVHAAFFRMIWKYQKTIPRTHPLYSILAISAALVVRCLSHGLVDHYWSRGPILQAWGAAGMAICAVRALRRPRPRPRPAEANFGFPEQFFPGAGPGPAGMRGFEGGLGQP